MLGCSSVFVIPDSVTCQPSKCSLVKLKHPRSDVPCLYLWDGQSSELFEIQKIEEKCRSWILGENVKSDGGMYVCSRIDPLFFFISFCRKNDKFISWDAILGEIGGCFDVFNNIPNIETRLEEICDKKCIGSISVYRFNESKAIEWLSNRVSAVYKASFHCKNPVLVSQLRLIATSSSSDQYDGRSEDSRVPEFTSNSKEAQLLSTNQLSHQICLNLAYQLIADYLSSDLLIKLQEKIGLKTIHEVHLSDRNSSENIDPVNQSFKKSFDDSKNYQPKEDYSSAFKSNESKINEPIIKKIKLVKGVQSITKFFHKT
ncbi:unnamed protein product [Schistosoma spindalis]|nr:unnamed protein product [Schistosoma spindale]